MEAYESELERRFEDERRSLADSAPDGYYYASEPGFGTNASLCYFTKVRRGGRCRMLRATEYSFPDGTRFVRADRLSESDRPNPRLLAWRISRSEIPDLLPMRETDGSLSDAAADLLDSDVVLEQTVMLKGSGDETVSGSEIMKLCRGCSNKPKETD